MFESVCIRRQQLLDAPEPLDLGFLAEALLFYQNVHLIADRDILSQLVSQCGSSLVIELIEEGFLKISYVDKLTAIRNFDVGTSKERHQPITAWDTKGNWRLEKFAPLLFSQRAGGPGFGRQQGRRFAELVPTIDIGDDLLSAVRADFAEQEYIEKAVALLLNVLAPTYRLPQDYRFKINQDGDKFFVDTNIDFRQANDSFNQRVQKQNTGDTLSIGSLLLYILEARGDLFFASQENAELATHPGSATIIDVKFRDILSKRSNSQHNIEAFQELVLANGHEIGESINVGYRTWRDLLDLLKKARKFKKDWLRQVAPDASLIFEYNRAIEKDTWVGTLPAKIFRFLIFTGGGSFTPPLVSVGLSAVDAFIVDRLLGGWKPNQFVSGPLKDFARLD